MSERKNAGSERSGSSYGSTMPRKSQSHDAKEHAHFYHYYQPRPIYSYNMHNYYPTPPIKQSTSMEQLPWTPVTSSSAGGLWCSTGLPGLNKVHRPTPVYMSSNYWIPFAQGRSTLPVYTEPGCSYSTSQPSRELSNHAINKPSVIKHTSNTTKATSTISKISPKCQAESDIQEKLQNHNEHVSLGATPEKKEEQASTSNDENGVPVVVHIKEEKVDSPESLCCSTPSYNHHDYHSNIFEEASPKERMNELDAMHLLPGSAYSSMCKLSTESAFKKPATSSPSMYPIQYDPDSAFQKPSSAPFSLQYSTDMESAFKTVQKPSSKMSKPVSDLHDAEQGTSGLSYDITGSSNTTASPSRKPKANKHVCDECGRSFTRSSTLVTHKRIHTGEKPFECEICGRAFRQPGNLSRHRLTHTTSKPYVCPHCNKAFNRASNLHTHMRTHSDYKPYECEYCDKRFHQKVDMKIHRYTHTGEKPHRCPKCGRGFKQLTHLTYHLRTHSDVRMYNCEFCGKGFNQKGNLQAHRYRHTGERPFKCDVCGKGFTLASTRNTHLRTHATKKPFECQYCDKSFYQKNALKTHYIASHPYTDGVLIL